ncbi:hypothetical protein GTP46_13245 [Duganella sp. FT135W]|uniref:BrnT family toxin n=1 Tax=Duganella flavida TaxID=2692175 RepID=A0A6L8KCY2_9BURK|nr:hypothetical protein [Duganella flavida]
MGPNLYCVVFVERSDVLRIISLRRAKTSEEARYVSQRT